MDPVDLNQSLIDGERRFGAVARLFGETALERFARARVAVVGIGGVGTWTAEALARSGVANLTLIDLDHVAPGNTNRQIHALEGEFGRAKVLSMAARIEAIHPGANVAPVEDFVTPENAARLLEGHDVIVDCADQVPAKAAMAALARDRRAAIVVCGAAGGRRDPSRVRREDLARTHGDALLAEVRRRLRRMHGFPAPGPRKLAARFGVEAVFSDEPMTGPGLCAGGEGEPGSPLACGGYGSVVTVTATMGMVAAACALERILDLE